MEVAATENRFANTSLVQVTTRIRGDQKYRLEAEGRARGETIADSLRNNLDLAFAIKAELAKIIEGEYDENDPKNAPRLVHTLLFRVEERILGALDGLSNRLEKKLIKLGNPSSEGSVTLDDSIAEPAGVSELEIISSFISLITGDSEHSVEVWLGAFLEIIPRLELVSMAQLSELQEKGEDWLRQLREEELVGGENIKSALIPLK